MFRAAWKSLLGRKLRLVMSTFAIVLGVAFVVGTLIFTDTLQRSFTSIFASSVGDVVVQPRGGTNADGSPSAVTIPAALEKKLQRELGDAARVDGNVIAVGAYVIGTDNKPVVESGAPAMARNFTTAPAGHGIKGLVIDQGRAPKRAGEVVLNGATAKAGGYSIGDPVPIATTGEKSLIRPELVGTAEFAEGGSLNGATMALFETRTAQRLFLDGDRAFNTIWVTARPGVGQDQLRDEVAPLLPKKFEALTGDQAAEKSASELMESLSFLTTFLLIFAGISLVVGTFLIVNTFSILVAQRSRELALLRALGASARQVRHSVMIEAALTGLIGSVLGIGLGIGLAYGLKALFAQFGLDLSGTPMVLEPRTIGTGLAVGLLVTLFAAYLPARRTSKIPPVAALGDDIAMPEQSLRRRLIIGLVMCLVGAVLMMLGLNGTSSEPAYLVGAGILLVLLGVAATSPVLGRPFLAVVERAYALVFGSVGRLAGQNALRNPRRTAATASALMIGLALCTTMAIAGASMKKSVDVAVQGSMTSDLVVSSAMGQGFSPAITDRVGRVEGVGAVTRLRFGSGKSGGSFAGVTGVDPKTLAKGMKVEMIEGSIADLSRPKTVLLSDKRAEEAGLKVGDTYKITTSGGENAWKVIGLYADNQLLSGRLVSLKTLQQAGFRAQDNMALVSVADGADRQRVQGRIKMKLREEPMVAVKDQAELVSEQRKMIDSLVLMVYALLGLALVIAVLGIVNTLALSVIERTREVGLLRAIGLTRPQLRRMIALESVVIAVLGALLGVAMGLLFGWALTVALRDQGLVVTEIPTQQLWLFLGLSFVIGVVAALFPARRAANLDVLDAIATE